MSSRTVSGRDPASGRSIEIEIEDGRVSSVQPGPKAETAWISAGLIDLQVNGYGGYDLNAGNVSIEIVEALATALCQTGVTTFLPTLVTASEESLVSALTTIAAARASDPWLEYAIPFVHVEGPHIAPDDGPRGAHPREHVRPPNPAEFERLQAACGGIIGMVTLSPHWPEAPGYIRDLARRGVQVAIGHTNATAQEITAAVDAGATLSTHLGNGAAAMLPRHPNLLWAQLAEDRLTATFIADGHHLPADTLRAMLRSKGLERSVLVSDTVALAGMKPGVYEQAVGGRVELTVEGRLGVVGTPFLAGAARPLCDGVAFAVNWGGLHLSEALRLATGNPGRFCKGRGTVRVGVNADLVRFHWSPGDSTLAFDRVMVQGVDRL